MNAYRKFSGAMRTRSTPYSSRRGGGCGPECLCDNCCRERLEKNPNAPSSAYSKDMYQPMFERKR